MSHPICLTKTKHDCFLEVWWHEQVSDCGTSLLFTAPSRTSRYECLQDHGDPGGYILKPDGTYAYDRAYLEELARVNGFEIVILKRHSTMIQRGDAAPGYMGVFKKAM